MGVQASKSEKSHYGCPTRLFSKMVVWYHNTNEESTLSNAVYQTENVYHVVYLSFLTISRLRSVAQPHLEDDFTLANIPNSIIR